MVPKTYRTDLYYIDERDGRVRRQERVVSWWQFWLTFLFSPKKWRRSGPCGNVLWQRAAFSD